MMLWPDRARRRGNGANWYQVQAHAAAPIRKIRWLPQGWSLTAGVALLSYGLNSELSLVYLVIAMPMTVLLDLIVRYTLRKHLHRLRSVGKCMSTVVAVGHPAAVADLVKELRRYHYHGLEVVAACLAGGTQVSEVAGVPVVGDLDDTAEVVRRSGASTVAVLP